MNKLGVFNAPVLVRGAFIGHQWGDYAKFPSDEQARAAAHAINNHDKLVDFVKLVANSDTRTHAHKHLAKELLKELGHEI